MKWKTLIFINIKAEVYVKGKDSQERIFKEEKNGNHNKWGSG